MTKTCKLCGAGFDKAVGEPYHTARGKACLACLKREGLECRCYDHRLFRNDPVLAAAVASARAKATTYE